MFSFPNNNDKHLETLIFAVTLRGSSTKCKQLSNKTTISKENKACTIYNIILIIIIITQNTPPNEGVTVHLDGWMGGWIDGWMDR